jgi:hypothetical protein
MTTFDGSMPTLTVEPAQQQIKKKAPSKASKFYTQDFIDRYYYQSTSDNLRLRITFGGQYNKCFS